MVLPGIPLFKLIEGLDARVSPKIRRDALVYSVVRNCGEIRPGCLYCEVPGSPRGPRPVCPPVATVTENPEQAGEELIGVPDAAKAFLFLTARLTAFCSTGLSVAAVTGTKGKTTSVHLLHAVALRRDSKAGVISSLFRGIGDRRMPAHTSTPSPPELQRLLFQMREAGAKAACIEATSIGIAEHRLDGLRCDGLLFTNLGTDHFSFHGGRDAYVAAKRRLFRDHDFHGHNCIAAVNADDASAHEILIGCDLRRTTFGLCKGDLRPTKLQRLEGSVVMHVEGAEFVFEPGSRHEMLNVLGVYALSRALGYTDAEIQEGIAQAPPLPGRRELILDDGARRVYIDSAHTPESVTAVLRRLRAMPVLRRPLVAVVGASDSSSRVKRSMMTRAALALADHVVATCYNISVPHQDRLVLEDLQSGLDGVAKSRLDVDRDRRDAIARALSQIRNGGTVVLLGRGSEGWLAVRGIRVLASDRDVVRRISNAD